MAKVTKETRYVLSYIEVGDVFLCVEDHKGLIKGQLLVVTAVFPEGGLKFASNPVQAAMLGDGDWLEEEINARRIRYVGDLRHNILTLNTSNLREVVIA